MMQAALRFGSNMRYVLLSEHAGVFAGWLVQSFAALPAISRGVLIENAAQQRL